MIMACGTGKTLTVLWINEALDSERTLILLPSLLLLSKTISEWIRHCKHSYKFLAVCSDSTVANEDGVDYLAMRFPTLHN